MWLVVSSIWSLASRHGRNGRDRAPPEAGREQTCRADGWALGKLTVRSTRPVTTCRDASLAQDAGRTAKGTVESLPLTTATLSIW